MAKPKDTGQWALLLRLSDHNDLSQPLIVVTASVTRDTDDGLRSPVYDSYGDDTAFSALDALQVRAQSDGARWYGWEVSYHQPYTVDIDRAQSMIRVLRSVASRLTALDQRFGRPSSFAQYMARVADALGITNPRPFIINDSEHAPRIIDWRHMDVSALEYRLDRARREFREKYRITAGEDAA